MTKKPSQTGLVLTGGGARAAYQVGVLSALAEIIPPGRNPFPVLAGTSAGAINIAYLASRAHLSQDHFKDVCGGLKNLWENLSINKIYRTDGFSLSAIATGWISRTLLGGKGGTRKTVNYLLDTEPLKELLLREVDFPNISASISAGNLKGVSITATHYQEGVSVSFFNGQGVKEWTRSSRMGLQTELSVEHILASAAIPIFFPPISINGSAFGDGCLRQTTPLSPAIHLGAEKLLCIGIKPKRKQSATATSLQHILTPPKSSAEASLAQIGGELMNSLFLDSLDSDIERMERINISLQSFTDKTREKHFGELRQIPILSLGPSRDLSEVVPNLIKKFPLLMRYLLRGIGATDREGSNLVSYLAFDPEFLKPLMEIGYHDTLAERAAIEEFMEI
jgi:NTE family protein